MTLSRGQLIFHNKEAYVVVNSSETGVTAISQEDLDRTRVSRIEVSDMSAAEFEKFCKERSIRTLKTKTSRKWPAKSEFKNVPGTRFWR